MKKGILDFAQNFNVLGPPSGTLSIAKKNLKSLLTYPNHSGIGVGSEAAAKFFSVPSNSIALAHGATEVLFNAHEFLDYRRALIPTPTFWEYSNFNTRFSIPVEIFQSSTANDYALNVDSLDKVIQDGDAVFLCNINNPTSTLTSGNKILELVKKHPYSQFIVDETYLLFHPDFAHHTLSGAATEHQNLHVVASFSKLFSLPGLRAGILISDHETIERYKAVSLIPYSISDSFQEILSYVLSKNSFVQKTRNYYLKRREEFFLQISTELEGVVRPLKSEGNFMLLQLLTDRTSEEVTETLRDKGILIRGGHELEGLGNKWLRVAIRDPRDSARLVQALAHTLQRTQQ